MTLGVGAVLRLFATSVLRVFWVGGYGGGSVLFGTALQAKFLMDLIFHLALLLN